MTYTIATHKPEFTVSVLPGNIWTKEFTVEEITVDEGKGNLEAIKKNLVYQYQENGEWKDCDNQDSRQQVFAEHPSNRNYKVRALYRGALASNEVDVEMEEPKALPNGNMDEWMEIWMNGFLVLDIINLIINHGQMKHGGIVIIM